MSRLSFDDTTISMSLDGDSFCVLLGANILEGLAGFGHTLTEAIEAFDFEYQTYLSDMGNEPRE